MNGWIETQEQIDERWSRRTFEAAKVTNCLEHTTEAEADRLHELIEEALSYETGLPFLALSDTVSIAITPKVARFMDAPAIVDTASASTPKEQTYQEFQKLAEKYAPKPFIPKPNCEHKNEYATRGGMMCRDCHKTREAVTDFEKRLVSKLTPRANGYVNYGMR